MQGNEKRNEGLCLVCARELNVPQIKEYMDQMGVTDEDIEEFADAMSGVKDNFDMEMFNQGGTNSLPNFFNALFGGPVQNDGKTAEVKNEAGDDTSEAFERRERIKNGKEPKGSKNKKRKFLSSFCTDLTARAREGKLDPVLVRPLLPRDLRRKSQQARCPSSLLTRKYFSLILPLLLRELSSEVSLKAV